tara:strand:+ start:201 stop:698 length:498 start_codon:yes stop_codon:yes gene_type:complete
MHNYFFYGTLRSISILEKVIGNKTDHLEINPAFAPQSELRLVINENFPVIVFDDSYSGVEGIVVKGLTEEDIARIRFFEDVEFSPKTMVVEISGIQEEVNYFSQKGVEPSLDAWFYDKWKEKEEALTLLTTDLWMQLYGKYTAEEADQYWNDVKKQAYHQYQSQQ